MAECTCRIKATLGAPGGLRIEKCPLCKSAPKLLVFAEKVADTLDSTINGASELWLGQLRHDAIELVRSAGVTGHAEHAKVLPTKCPGGLHGCRIDNAGRIEAHADKSGELCEWSQRDLPEPKPSFDDGDNEHGN